MNARALYRALYRIDRGRRGRWCIEISTRGTLTNEQIEALLHRQRIMSRDCDLMEPDPWMSASANHVLVMKTHRIDPRWRSNAVRTVSRVARYVAAMQRLELEPRIVGLWTY